MNSDLDFVPATITKDVQVRLDTLNYASSLINENEANLDKARKDYQSLFSEATKVLSTHFKKLRSSIEKSRPYYELQTRKKELLEDLQLNSEAYKAVQTKHDDACSVLQSCNKDSAMFHETDESKLETINSAVQKINATKRELDDLKKKHEDILSHCIILDENITLFRSRMNMAIRRARPYFDVHASYNRKMQDAKIVIDRLTVEVKSAKRLYAQTMHSLEAISNRIHESRRIGRWLSSPLISRSRGVGAEGPITSTGDVAVISASCEEGQTSNLFSIPSSPRRTPPGQADTDTEAESEDEGGKSFFESLNISSLSKFEGSPQLCKVASPLRPRLMECRLQNTHLKCENRDLALLAIRPRLRSQSL